MAVRLAAFQRCGHGTASLMAHHDEQRYLEVVGRVFEACDLGLSRDVARHPHFKQIAEALIEHDFRRHP